MLVSNMKDRIDEKIGGINVSAYQLETLVHGRAERLVHVYLPCVCVWCVYLLELLKKESERRSESGLPRLADPLLFSFLFFLQCGFVCWLKSHDRKYCWITEQISTDKLKRIRARSESVTWNDVDERRRRDRVSQWEEDQLHEILKQKQASAGYMMMLLLHSLGICVMKLCIETGLTLHPIQPEPDPT